MIETFAAEAAHTILGIMAAAIVVGTLILAGMWIAIAAQRRCITRIRAEIAVIGAEIDEMLAQGREGEAPR